MRNTLRWCALFLFAVLCLRSAPAHAVYQFEEQVKDAISKKYSSDDGWIKPTAAQNKLYAWDMSQESTIVNLEFSDVGNRSTITRTVTPAFIKVEDGKVVGLVIIDQVVWSAKIKDDAGEWVKAPKPFEDEFNYHETSPQGNFVFAYETNKMWEDSHSLVKKMMEGFSKVSFTINYENTLPGPLDSNGDQVKDNGLSDKEIEDIEYESTCLNVYDEDGKFVEKKCGDK